VNQGGARSPLLRFWGDAHNEGQFMFLDLLMLLLLVALFALCGALVRFAETIIRPSE